MNPARAQKLDRYIVNDYFEKLENLMIEFNLLQKPDRIFNLAEKG